MKKFIKKLNILYLMSDLEDENYQAILAENEY